MQLFAILFAQCYYTLIQLERSNMTKTKDKKTLSPIERLVRDNVVWHLDQIGLGVTSIANIINAPTSTISRIIDRRPEKLGTIDKFIFMSNNN